MKKMKTSTITNAALAGVVALALFMPETALAQDARNLKTILQDRQFRDAITLGFGIFAFIKWIDYFANFDTGKALMGLIIPAMATFMAFKWTTVLNWFGLA